LCARNTGIGADGVEFFAWTGPKSGRIRLHNADGSIAEISGNGTRCVAAWMARERGFQPGDELRDYDRCWTARMQDQCAQDGWRIHRRSDRWNGRSFLYSARTVTLANGLDFEGVRNLHWQSAFCNS
jgi:diaminopimelate epimerase